MKPIFTSSFSGLSEPAAYTAERRAGDTPTAPTAAACNTVRRDNLVFSRSVISVALHNKNKKQKAPTRGTGRCRMRTPLSGSTGASFAVEAHRSENLRWFVVKTLQ